MSSWRAAAIAVAPAMLRTVYHDLATEPEYPDRGPDYYENRDISSARAAARPALGTLGAVVTVEAVVWLNRSPTE